MAFASTTKKVKIIWSYLQKPTQVLKTNFMLNLNQFSTIIRSFLLSSAPLPNTKCEERYYFHEKSMSVYVSYNSETTYQMFRCIRDAKSSSFNLKPIQKLDWRNHKCLNRVTFHFYTSANIQFVQVWWSYIVSNMY